MNFPVQGLFNNSILSIANGFAEDDNFTLNQKKIHSSMH